jgi:hypothetical protein
MKGPRKALGYTFIAAGGAATLVFLSPIFPIGVEAFLVGGVFFGIGAWFLAGKEIRDLVFKLLKLRTTQRPEAPLPPPAIDPLLPVKVLKLAKERQGVLTVSEVAISLSVPLDHAEQALKVCVKLGNALLDFDSSRGYTFYTFPEYLPPGDRTLSS